MYDRIPYLLNILYAEENKVLPEKLRLFESVTNALFVLTQSLYEAKEDVDYHQQELENKYFRFGLANQSIIRLIKGNEFSILSNKVVMVDVFSVFSITRMQIESFTIMYYLFFDKQPIDTLRFRYDIYKLHGIIKHSLFPALTEESRQKQAILIKEIEIISQRIKETHFYINASSKIQKQYLNPKYAKLSTTDDVLALSGLKHSHFDTIWSLYSNHVHSEHISDRQYNHIYIHKKTTTEEAALVLTLNSIMTAKLCLFLMESFTAAKRAFENLSMEDKVLIQTWGTMGENKTNP